MDKGEAPFGKGQDTVKNLSMGTYGGPQINEDTHNVPPKMPMYSSAGDTNKSRSSRRSGGAGGVDVDTRSTRRGFVSSKGEGSLCSG